MTTEKPMHRISRKRVAAGVLGAVLLAGLATGAGRSVAQTPPTQRNGLVCTTGTGTTPTFNLETKTGYINLPDGNTAFMWGYNEVGKPFQHPGAVLCVNQGDTVTVNLHNNLAAPVSIMFPGQDSVTANGAPAQPQFDSAGKATSLTNTANASGGNVTYSFVAGNPGTYIYESGTDAQTQVRMGLFGALIVRPTQGALFAYNRPDSQFTSGEEFLVLLSEIDPYQHQAAEAGQPFDITTYHPRYWLINGRGFPDSVADNFASFLPSQPYGALAHIHPWDPTTHPQPGLARYINVGTEDYPMHPHGNNGSLIGRDGKPLEGPGGQDLSMEKFSFNIGPSQTWDVLFKWYDAEHYTAAGNPVPVTVPNVANQVFGMFYSGSPYLGTTGTLPPGASTLNQCGEFYIIAHNHALYQITSWGVNMTGPITYMRVDPPLPNNCPA